MRSRERHVGIRSLPFWLPIAWLLATSTFFQPIVPLVVAKRHWIDRLKMAALVTPYSAIRALVSLLPAVPFVKAYAVYGRAGNLWLPWLVVSSVFPTGEL